MYVLTSFYFNSSDRSVWLAWNKYVVVCSEFEEWNLKWFLLIASARIVHFLKSFV